MIKNLYIDHFRAMKNFDIPLGSALTAIAGQNATGKSTLLGIIGNTFQLPQKSGKTVLGNAFKTEFSEILNGSKDKDTTGIIGKIAVDGISELDNHVPSEAHLRVAWQKEKGKDRFRVIPKRYYEDGFSPTKSNFDERKYILPSYYLGLSRLYPVGETEQEKIVHSSVRLSAEEFTWYTKNYNMILDLNEEIEVLNQVKITQKQSIGITTATYDYLTNSAGQDNLGQILMALLSFKRLKRNYEADHVHWDGGILFIDEIDATLHPAAKEKLIRLLYKEAKENQIQIIFTTHSLSILRIINSYESKHHDCNIIYLTTANIDLQMIVNPNFEMVENDMNISSFYDNMVEKQITIYSEDEEARWFIKHLLKDYSSRIRLVNYSDGCDKLLSLLDNDPEYFKNILFIFDGDMNEDMKKYKELKHAHANIIKLPIDSLRPEKVFYDYLISLDSTHELLTSHLNEGLTIRKLKSEGPDSEKYTCCTAERERYKNWFKDNLDMFNSIGLYEYWANDNQQHVNNFLKDFIRSFNILAARTHIPPIK